MNAKEIATRIRTGKPVTEQEYLFLLTEDRNALWAFLIRNNPGNINNTLRHKLGYIELGFAPDAKALSRTIETMIQKGLSDELKVVLESFVLNTKGLSQEFINGLQKEFAE